jgi:hypothetical protein
MYGETEAAQILGINTGSVSAEMQDIKHNLGVGNLNRLELFYYYQEHNLGANARPYDGPDHRSQYDDGGRYSGQDVDDVEADPDGDYY